MASYFSGGIIWCTENKMVNSARSDDGKILAIDTSDFIDGHAHTIFSGC